MEPRRWLTPVVLAIAMVAAATILLVPLVDGQTLIGYTNDDAFITFRYSENMGNGHGPSWNHVGPPVDGYTSMAWMFLLALPVWLGIDVEVAAKVLSLLSAAGIVAMLALAGGAQRAVVARVVAIAALVMSPTFLALSAQGMETVFAAMLATGTAWLTVLTLQRPEGRRFALLGITGLLAVLARPDLLVFVGICFGGVAAWLAATRDWRALRRGIAWIAGVFVLPGLLWAVWRWSYYGYPLPNTAYVKGDGGFTNPLSRFYVRTFATQFAPPYLLAVAVLAVRGLLHRRSDPDRAGLWGIGVTLAAAIAYLAATLFVIPIQGNFWRFQMPAYPALLLCGVLLAARDPLIASIGTRGKTWARVAAVAALVALIVFPLSTIGDTRTQIRGRWTYDREQAGKALARFRDDGLFMFVTEAGVLPYYAGWRSTDLLGLNDHELATVGAGDAYIDSLRPDLLQFVFDFPRGGFPAFNRLLVSGDYRLAAAVEKTNSDLDPGVPEQAHFYFVRSDSPRAAEVTEALRGLRVRPLPAVKTQQVLRQLGYRAGPQPG